MAFFQHFATRCDLSPAGKNDVGRRRRGSAIAALGLAMGCALAAPAVLAQSSPSPTLSGNWQLACTGHGGQVRQISLQIEQQGSKLSGSFHAAGGRSGQVSGNVQGNAVSLELAGKRRSATLTGTTDGKTLQMQSARGASCKATRQ